MVWFKKKKEKVHITSWRHDGGCFLSPSISSLTSTSIGAVSTDLALHIDLYKNLQADVWDSRVWTGLTHRALTGAEAFNCPDDVGAQQPRSWCIFSFPVSFCLINLFTFSLPSLSGLFYPFLHSFLHPALRKEACSSFKQLWVINNVEYFHIKTWRNGQQSLKRGLSWPSKVKIIFANHHIWDKKEKRKKKTGRVTHFMFLMYSIILFT